jgi:hypothetical protein
VAARGEPPESIWILWNEDHMCLERLLGIVIPVNESEDGFRAWSDLAYEAQEALAIFDITVYRYVPQYVVVKEHVRGVLVPINEYINSPPVDPALGTRSLGSVSLLAPVRSAQINFT